MKLSGVILVAISSAVISARLLGSPLDFDNYREIYLNSSEMLWAGNYTIDIGWLVINALFLKIGFTFPIFIFTLTLLSLSIKYQAISLSLGSRKSVFVFMCMYYAYLFWIQDYTQYRIAVAISFVLAGIYGLSGLAKKFLPYSFGMLIQISSSLLSVFSIFFSSKRANYYFLVILLCLVFSWCISVIGIYYILERSGDLSIPFLYKLHDYVAKYNEGEFSELNIFSPAPIMQLIFLLCTARFAKTSLRLEYYMALTGIASFYSFLSLPILAVRVFEIFSIFFLIYLSKLVVRIPLATVFVFLYIVLGLRSVFFSSHPVVI